MKNKSLIAISCIISTLILGIVVTYVMPTPTPKISAETVIKVFSDVSELGDPVTMPDIRNSTFSVAVVVEDTNLTSDMGLFGFDVQFNWTTEWITYTDFTVTQPVEDYPAVQPPSPYAGILHESTFKLKEVVDENDAIPEAEPGTMAWIAYAIMPGTPLFNGSGTICVFTFNVTDQPLNYEGSKNIKIHFLKTDLSDSVPSPINHTVQELDITLHPREFEIEYPPSPEAVDVQIDPDGDFGVFWSEGTFELADDIDNTEGWVHVAFMGFGATHNPVNGTIRIATIDFNVTHESELLPEGPLDLENPLRDQFWYILNAEGGLVDLSMPVTSEWLTVFPLSRYELGFTLTSWEDVDGDGELSEGDQIILLNKDTLKWYDYYVNSVQATLNLTMYPFEATDDYLWATDSWTVDGAAGKTTADFYGVFDGLGHADWTGNFTLDYPFTGVTSITANFVGNGSSTVLTPDVDYKVYPDEDKIELLTPVDVDIINEYYVAGQNGTPAGWPAIEYVATSIQSVYVKFPNLTERYANGGFGCFQTEPPCEWWFEPDYPLELEGWWALDFGYASPEAWPVNSSYWINYTAASYLTIDYFAEPDPRPYYLEFDGTLDEFAAITDPNGTWWHEVYPDYSNMWQCISTDPIQVSNDITLNFSGKIREYHIGGIAIDIEVIQKPCVQDLVPGDDYYTAPVIVEISGFSHPERPYSPWYGRNHVVRLPNAVENSTFKAIPEFNGLLVLLPLLLATVAIVVKRKLPKKK